MILSRALSESIYRPLSKRTQCRDQRGPLRIAFGGSFERRLKSRRLQLPRLSGGNRIIGRTNIWNATIVETGLPGNPKTNVPITKTEDRRFAGFHRHLVEKHFDAEFSKDVFHQIVLTHRHAARYQQDVVLQARGGSFASDLRAFASDTVHQRLGAGSFALRKKRITVAVANLPGLRRSDHIDQFVAGRNNRHARTASTRDTLVLPSLGQQPDIRKSQILRPARASDRPFALQRLFATDLRFAERRAEFSPNPWKDARCAQPSPLRSRLPAKARRS